MWNTTDGLKQYFTDRENNNGIPVVFIHGFPFDHSMWDNQFQELSEKFRPVCYDVRGHGLSEGGSRHYNIDIFVEDLNSLISHLNLEKPVLCGLSMGGYIALRAYELYPEGFSALILADTRSEADLNLNKTNRFEAMKNIQKHGTVRYANDSIRNLFYEKNVVNHPDFVQNIRSLIENTSETTLYGTIMAIAARTDSTEHLEKITIPTLIIVGAHDVITPPIVAESMHEKIKGSELQIIPDAGHLSNLENPEAFNASLFSFLENVFYSS